MAAITSTETLHCPSMLQKLKDTLPFLFKMVGSKDIYDHAEDLKIILHALWEMARLQCTEEVEGQTEDLPDSAQS